MTPEITAALDAYGEVNRQGAGPLAPNLRDARRALESAIAEAISAAASKAANEARAERHEQTKYNGWTNYATWRVNLELLDDYLDSQAQDIENGYLDKYTDVYDLSQQLQQYTEEVVSGEMTGETGNELAVSYADAFISDVNYYEIAEHFAADRPECMASDDDDTDDDDDEGDN